MSRMFNYDPILGQFMSPSLFYARVADNPKVKPRLKKKALGIVANWEFLGQLGKQNLDAYNRDTFTFEYWMEHRKVVRKLDLGYAIRYNYPLGLKAAHRETLEFYAMHY